MVRGQRRDALAIALPVVLVSLLLLGGVGVAVVVLRERSDAQKNDREVAELTRADVTATVDEAVAALAGAASILNEDGTDVDLDRWKQFAAEAVDRSIIESLGVEVEVSREQRPAFEAMVGPILEPGPTGLVPAGDREVYFPIRDVVPPTVESGQLYGWDIAADPIRRAAMAEAVERGEIVISETVESQPTRRPAFFVVQPLFRMPPDDRPVEERRTPLTPANLTIEQRRDALVGFTTTGVVGETLTRTAAARLPPGTRFTLHDGDVELAATASRPENGATTEFTVAGRDWLLTADDGSGPNYTPAWVLAIATLLVTGSIALLLRARIQVQRLSAADAYRHARSADLGQALAEARTTSAVADAVHRAVPALLGAANASVRTLDDSRQVIGPVIDEGLPAALAAVDIRADRRNPAGLAVIENRWVLINDVSTTRGQYDEEFVSAVLDANYQALAFIPLESHEHEVVGVLGVAWNQPTSFDPITMSLLRSVGELCEQTLERSRLHDSEHHLVERLQHGALNAPGHLPGVDVAVRYESAMDALSIGGDWYDVIVLDDHAVGLVVGDVAGHGVPAVAEMIELRSAIHALLRANQPIDEIFAVADEILGAAEQTRIATATVAVFDARAGCVRYASAGHPPALLRARDGSVEILLDARRPVLGVPSTEGYAVAERPFERGATFVAYTDGLIERRHEDLLDSINRLAELLAETDLDGEPLADAILAARGDVEATTDDVALVVACAT